MRFPSSSCFVYRPAQNADELEALLRLRYQVFRSSNLAKFCDENPDGIDMDSYDIRSHHYGMFPCTVDGWKAPVAYQRVIFETPQSEGLLIEAVAAKYPSLKYNIEPKPSYPFYYMYNSSYGQAVNNFHVNAKSRGESIGEASRFSIDPSIRSVRIMLFAMESIIVHEHVVRGLDWSFTLTYSDLARFFRRFGFQEFPDTQEEIICNVPFTTLLISFPALVEGVKAKLEKMGDVCRKYGAVWFHPDQPEDFGPP